MRHLKLEKPGSQLLEVLRHRGETPTLHVDLALLAQYGARGDGRLVYIQTAAPWV
jgi:hypothetical protein